VWGGGRVHAILGRHITDAKGRLKRQILKHGKNASQGTLAGENGLTQDKEMYIKGNVG